MFSIALTAISSKQHWYHCFHRMHRKLFISSDIGPSWDSRLFNKAWYRMSVLFELNKSSYEGIGLMPYGLDS